MDLLCKTNKPPVPLAPTLSEMYQHRHRGLPAPPIALLFEFPPLPPLGNPLLAEEPAVAAPPPSSSAI